MIPMIIIEKYLWIIYCIYYDSIVSLEGLMDTFTMDINIGSFSNLLMVEEVVVRADTPYT